MRRTLLLGGTWFLGRAIVEAALLRGREITIFNRGRSGPDLPNVESVHGDRTNTDDLQRLARLGPWDVVIDTSASEMAPRQVLDSSKALASVVDRYVYVSTVNAYKGWPNEPLSEASPLYPALPNADRDFGVAEGVTLHYGKQKAGAEAAVSSVFGSRATILRPSVILGPGEYVGRLPWWLRRAERGESILAPGRPDKTIQPIDVRDVADFALMDTISGAYNLAAPQGRATMNDLLTTCVTVTGRRGHLVWAADEVLTSHGVREWTELPLWRTAAGTWAVDTTRAQAAGLVCRPLTDTVADTWAWLCDGDGPVAHPRWADHGIDPVKEAAILAELD
ncbi:MULTISPECIES: NAD-dependent epimerase/dehydratase family protein [unclassified Streptomyces]|uniref:NAD-dependent epimerase/dehydratase family protein n=1 Tax=Streptomyces sp. NBC_00060 TaxID=2975636 RepID=A0AAU2H6L3_9ACTN